MSKLLVFTENYAIGGGNRYLVDVLNSIGPGFTEVFLVSNRGGLFPQDLQRIDTGTVIGELPVLSRDALYLKSGLFSSGPGRLLFKAMAPLDALLFAYNYLVCLACLLGRSPDLVLCCNGGYPGGKSEFAMALAAATLRRKVIMTIASAPAARRYGFLSSTADALLWRVLDRVIVNSRYAAEALSGVRGLPAGRAKILYNGVPRPAGKALPKRNDAEFVFGYLSRVERAKGVMTLLEAFSRLSGRHPGARLVLAGPPGDAARGAAEYIESAGLRERVSLTGIYHGDVTGLLSTFDAFVFPSFWEGLPYSLLEAMSCRLPIVATSVGGIPEVLGNETEGLLVPPGDAAALESAMERMLLLPELRRDLARKAWEKYESLFTIDAMRSRALEVFAGV